MNLVVLLLLALPACVLSWVRAGPATEDPDKPGFCMINKYIKTGETITTEDCVRTTCGRMGPQLSITEEGCLPQHVGRGCYTAPGDKAKPYPGCCPQVECTPFAFDMRFAH